jgi:septum formation protein
MKEIVLASASERRSRILSDCGIAHRVVPSGAEETMEKDRHISEIVRINACRKAETVAAGTGEAVVIGADTLVVCGGDIMGKPVGEDEARNILKKLSGNEIEVYTGICVMDLAAGKKVSGSERSVLRVVSMADNQVEEYFRLLAPYDKAGGFSIEGVGSLLFDDIRGSYFNILGLPMIKLGELFGEIGLNILDFVKKDK